MSAVAVILARAGSKGLPGKNTRPIVGKPCIAWTIEAALAARGVSRVLVSTDDTAAAWAARVRDAEVVGRPAELAGDTATIDAAARHALCAAAPSGARRDPVVILYANVPVRPEGLIDRALDTLARTGADSVQSYARVGKHHPWWTARVDEASGAVAPWEGDVLNHGVFRRQDLPPAFVPDGGVIAVVREALMLEIPGVAPGPHAFFGSDRRGVVSEEGDVVDIDTEIDALVAEAVLSRREGEGARS